MISQRGRNELLLENVYCVYEKDQPPWEADEPGNKNTTNKTEKLLQAEIFLN